MFVADNFFTSTKMENERIVAQKDRELDQMRQKLKGDKKESAQLQEKKTKEMKEKIDLLQKDLDNAAEKQVDTQDIELFFAKEATPDHKVFIPNFHPCVIRKSLLPP